MPAGEAREGRGRVCRGRQLAEIFFLACLLMWGNSSVLASDASFGGRLTLSRRITVTDSGWDSELFGLTGTLNGVGFIWRPWLATYSLKLDLSQIATELAGPEEETTQQTTSELVSGSARLNLFPRSRFPSLLFVDAFDSRTESDTVGIPLEEINLLRRERAGVTQHYRPPAGESRHTLQTVRTKVFQKNAQQETTDDVTVSGSRHLDNETFDYTLRLRNTAYGKFDSGDFGAGGTPAGLIGPRPTDPFAALGPTDPLHGNGEGQATLNHTFRPAPHLTVETTLDAASERERLETSRSSEDNQSATTAMAWRPAGSKWSARANVGAERSQELEAGGGENPTGTLKDSQNASVGAGYQITPNLGATGTVGASQDHTNDAPLVRSDFQELGLNYSPPPTALGEVKYRWNAVGTVGNTDSNQSEAVQAATLGLQHGLDRLFASSEGRTVALSATQGASQFRNSDDTDLFTLSHLFSGAVNWVGRRATNRLQGTLVDTRISGQQPGSEEQTEVDRVIDALNMLASHRFQPTRFSALEGSINLGRTRIADGEEVNRYAFARVGTGFAIRHVFRVDRLSFRSRLEYSVQQSDFDVPDGEAAPFGEFGNEEERMSWDSLFTYAAGLLELRLRRTVTEIDGNRTTTTALSLSRNF